MNTIKFIMLAAMLTFSGSSFADVAERDSSEKEKKHPALVENKALLSPEQEMLFKEGRLAETVVKPVYTSAEQLIFTAVLKEMKKEKLLK